MWWKEMHIPVYLYLSETSINFVHLHTFTWMRSELRSCSSVRFVVIFSFSIQLRSSLTFWVCFFSDFRLTHSFSVFSLSLQWVGMNVVYLHLCSLLLFTYVFTVSNTLVRLHRKARKQLGKLCSCSVKIKRFDKAKERKKKNEQDRKWETLTVLALMWYHTTSL